MTANAGAQHGVMIDRANRFPRAGSGRMTGIASIAGTDMLLRFATGNNAVMTRKTRAGHLCMIYPIGRNRGPYRGKLIVTGIAHIATGNVCGQFATGLHTVMTTDTVTGKPTMIHCRRFPRRGAVTNTTFFAGGDVSSILATGDNAVMAATTST